MTIFIGADHRGYKYKEQIESFLNTAGHDVTDKGAFELDPADDYPDYAFAVAEEVTGNPGSRGILLCGSGVGVDIAANKVRGIRAAYIESSEHAAQSREDDDTNVLVLDAITFDTSKDYKIIETWLNTEFSGAERHVRRIKKITDYEERNMK